MGKPPTKWINKAEKKVAKTGTECTVRTCQHRKAGDIYDVVTLLGEVPVRGKGTGDTDR